MTLSKRPPPTTTATAESWLRVARLLSTVLVVVMVAASIAGLRFRGVYREPASVAAMLRDYDLVALVIAVPLLVATLLPSRRESPRAQLLWVSVLAYSAYNYAIYVFGTAFNAAFLLHVAAFSLSVYALGLALAALDIPGIARRFRSRTRARLIAAVLAFLAAGLGGMWVFFSLRFAITGAPPGESLLVLPLAGVHLGYVLDLALLVPVDRGGVPSSHQSRSGCGNKETRPRWLGRMHLPSRSKAPLACEQGPSGRSDGRVPH